MPKHLFMFDPGIYSFRCNKCCGMYPKIIILDSDPFDDLFYFHCNKCGLSSIKCLEPSIAVESWNNMKLSEYQTRLF